MRNVNPFMNILENVNGVPELDLENVDLEEIEDQEDLDNIGVVDADEEFDATEDLFAEESRELNERLIIEPNTLPEEYDAHAQSGLATSDTFDAETDDLRQGKLFKDKKSLQNAVKQWSIIHNRKFSVRAGASNKTCWEVHCHMREATKCPWRLRGSMQKRCDGLWKIVSMTRTHTCPSTTTPPVHPSLTTCLITKEIAHLIADDPSIPVLILVEEIAKKYKVTIPYNNIWYAKQKIIAEIFGDWKESYSKLPRLLLALKHKNPGSVVSMSKTSPPDPVTNECQLIRLFWAFGPSLQGFKHCRPVISIDATHLYGKYKGKLLIAMGVDGDDDFFPVAFGIVKEETELDWSWFLRNLRNAVGQRPSLCLISDRNVNIIAAVNDPKNGWAAPLATHRFCLRHVRSNFNTLFRNPVLKKLVYKIGAELEMYKFEEGMKEMEKLHAEGWKWCKEIPKEQWSLAYDGGRRYGCSTTNLVECFNGFLLASRNLPICATVRLIYYRLVKCFVEKRNNWNRMIHMKNPHGITDSGVQQLDDSKVHAQNFHSFSFCRSRGIASVTSNIDDNQPVDLSRGSCGCGYWSQYKIPCGHAVQVCTALNVDYSLFVHEMYTLEAYRLTYAPQFYPLDHPAYWPSYDGPTLIPLAGTMRGIGRTRSK